MQSDDEDPNESGDGASGESEDSSGSDEQEGDAEITELQRDRQPAKVSNPSKHRSQGMAVSASIFYMSRLTEAYPPLCKVTQQSYIQYVKYVNIYLFYRRR